MYDKFSVLKICFPVLLSEIPCSINHGRIESSRSIGLIRALPWLQQAGFR
jgi:hypothetical protein